MICQQYKLISPKTIEPCFYAPQGMDKNSIVVRPKQMSICKADLRYYFGQRTADVLKKKLPLTLIHEAVGEVVYSCRTDFVTGQHVVLLPNIPGSDTLYQENYRVTSRFRSSQADGFMQELLLLPAEQLVKYDGIEPCTAALCELISVGMHAVQSFLQQNTASCKHITIFGDGAVGYVVACLLKQYLQASQVTIVGVNPRKLELFSFCDNIVNSQVDALPSFDHAFECVGGSASGVALQMIVDNINPQGIITLLGVSEELVPINTRLVLEKGLTLVGRSRSTREDFVEVVQQLSQNPVVRNRMSRLISDIVDINCIDDIHNAFALAQKADFKVLMNWKI